MARKKKRRKKRRKLLQKKRAIGGKYGCDLHHIFFQRHAWTGKWAKTLREMPYCKIMLPRATTHEAIHALVRTVPVPKEVSCQAAVEALIRLEELHGIGLKDPPKRRLIVLVALFECIEPKTVQALNQQISIVESFQKPL